MSRERTERGEQREERFREELQSGGKPKPKTSAAATGAGVHRRAHRAPPEGASPDLEWFLSLISSTGTSSRTKAHSASQGGREEKTLLSLAAHTRENGKTVGSSRPADERVPGGDKMTSTQSFIWSVAR